MKKANEILKHLLKPFDNELNKSRCLRKIIALMPQNYKKYVKKISYKGAILYIEVSHPALKTEIFYNRDKIFLIIKQMHRLNICKNINPTKIVTLYKYTPLPKPLKEIKFYLKEVKDFEIKAKNPHIKKKFEEIKKILKERD